MPLFILVFLLVFAGVNAYLLSRGWQLLESMGAHRHLYLAVTVLWALLFPVGMILKRQFDSAAADLLWYIGSWWLVVFLYALLVAVGFDFIRLALLVCGKKLSVITAPFYPQWKMGLFVAFALVVVAMAAVGTYNGTHAKVTTQEWTVRKTVDGLRELNIVAVSDMHLGAVYTSRSLRRWVGQINALKPDIVFLLGDTFDDNPAPVLRSDAGDFFAQIEAPMGVYAITGNHELMGRPAEAMAFLAKHGVRPLVDTAVLVDNRFYVVGRLDRSAPARKSINELTASLDKRYPLILLDHQPYEWEETARAGVDIRLSGHTHHGQLWPMNLITGRMYEQDWGYLQKGATHFYTSCGIGAWGPPVRIASRAEIVQVRVHFR
jgi:predicted MPP superfamily phosphohydrolase